MIIMLSNLKFPFLLLLGLTLVFGFSACNNDDDDVIPSEDRTIVEIAADGAQFSTLVSALERTGLDAVLADRNADFTVFAPTNDAFTALGVDLSTLTDDELSGILLYHVLGAEVFSSQIQEGKTYIGTAADIGPDGTQISTLIERVGATVTLNSTATVTTPDVDAVNGVIHVIDNVLLPLDIVGHASANDDFSQLVTAVGAASGDLISVLGNADQTYTVFAPINSAFEAISDVTIGLTNEELASVLTYHVVAGDNLLSSDLSDGQQVPTVQTESFTVNISNGNVTITDATGGIANVIFTDVQATNGVIHVLDKVILPNNL